MIPTNTHWQHEKHLLFNALMFYSRLPVPKETPYSPDLLNQSRKYFTFVGLIVGLIVCIAFVLCTLVLPLSIAILVSMIFGILATGAFHEDGFADTCDALGGGWEPEQILTIMKDSRIGTYGTVGLLGILSMKFILLLELANTSLWICCACALCAHSISRLQSSRLIKHYDYVQDIDKSKIKPIAAAPLDAQAERFSLLVAMAPCVLLAFHALFAVALGLILSHLIANGFMRYCHKRLGGYTGDVLGAIQQLAEVAFLVGCLVALGLS